ncbi:alpha/beta fold hydrolase [Catenulispora sp. NF23]|uniref:Alpha/beta fold hydrolase n=1 Tax=Catenulispora pinistramenti TaxID=2705254 RepID=A0ABS5L0T0_9ACTN|nr:alpha/beta hydrolase [Catenulispora pinistramenti]MBS2535166.1 alpha/beta fold hydrolase [Catenulispora pinistramenti]MBS2551760.1 alpha/beta fold hydrolase [Catenulispora pinistramenti]
MKTRIFEVAGAALSVEISGHEALPPLLLLHGGMGSTVDFAELVSLLADDYRFIRMDSRGHGRSTFGDVPLSYQRLEQDALAVLDGLGITRADVMGFSDGGVTALRLAAHHPDRVGTLFTIGSNWQLLEPSRAFNAQVTPQWWRDRNPEGPYSEGAYAEKNPEPDFERLVTENVAMWIDTAGYPGEDVRTITAPIVMIRGTDDHLSSHDLATALQAVLPGAALHEFPGAGHGVAASRPAEVATIIRGAPRNQTAAA